MNWRLLTIVATGLALLGASAAEPALAAKKKMRVARSACIDNYGGPTWRGILFNGEPRPNGCARPVFYGSRYIGQDPDPFIRSQLMRQPETGYTITK